MSNPYKHRLDRVLAELTATRPIAGGDVRALALATLTELFLESCRNAGTAPPTHFTELVTGLLPRVTPTTRAEISRQLAHNDAVPAPIVQLLVEDEPEVAGPMLRQSPLLSADTLLRVARDATLEKARAIASRADLGREVVAALIARGDAMIGAALIHAPNPRIEAHEADSIAALPNLPAGAAQRLIEIAPLSDQMLARLFWVVDRAGRAQVLERLMHPRNSVPASPAGTGGHPPHNRRAGSELLSHAAGGRIEAIIGGLASALEVPPALAERLVYDSGGEPLAVACRAAGLSIDQITGIVLLTCPAAGTSYDDLRALVDLAERLPNAVAQHMVALWRDLDTPIPRRARHEPAIAQPAGRARRGSDSMPGRLADEAARIAGDQRGR